MTNLRARVVEENIRLANVSIRFYSLSSGAVGNAFGLRRLVDSCITYLSGVGCCNRKFRFQGADLCHFATCLLTGRQDPGFALVPTSTSARALINGSRGSWVVCPGLRTSVRTLVFSNVVGIVRSNTTAALLITEQQRRQISLLPWLGLGKKDQYLEMYPGHWHPCSWSSLIVSLRGMTLSPIILGQVSKNYF